MYPDFHDHAMLWHIDTSECRTKRTSEAILAAVRRLYNNPGLSLRPKIAVLNHPGD